MNDDERSRAATPSPSLTPNSGGTSGEHELGISIEDQRRITDLYDSLNRIDHYRLLGVSATDSVKEIKRAYFALARTHHPDRWFRRDVGPLRAKIDAVFSAMTAAHETLTNAAARAEYDAYLREVLKTRMSRRQASALEAAKDFLAAADAWAKIVEKLPTDAYVQHRYARALLHARTGWPQAIAAATRAIELDPTRVEYRVTAASLHLAEGRDLSALGELDVACEIEPDRSDLEALRVGLRERISRAR